MKRSLAALALGALLAAPLAAEEAARAYEQGRYAEAVSLYQELAAKEPLDASLQYDLGNARFRAGQLGRAIASYQRAFELAPRDSDIRYNLNFALSRAGESLVPPGVPGALFALFHGSSSAELEVLFWLGFWVAGVLGGLCLFDERRAARLRSWALGATLVCALSASWWGLRRAAGVPDAAVLIGGEAEVRSGPGRGFPVSFKAPEGRRVSVLAERNGWVEIGVLKEGVKGWIPAESVEKI